MRNIESRTYRNIFFIILTLLLIAVVVIAIITYLDAQVANHSSGLRLAVEHHTEIMVIMVVIAIAFGFAWARVSYVELKRSQEESSDLTKVVLRFMSPDERAILNCLIEKSGTATQADISRLPGMNRVRAHRSLQRMQERALIDIEASGKVRRVRLKDEMRLLLRKEPTAEKKN